AWSTWGVTHPAQSWGGGTLRASSTMRSTPRWRRLKAQDDPAGPPPTISTGASIMEPPPAMPRREAAALDARLRLPQRQEQGELPPGGEPDLLHGIGHGHHAVEIALEVDVAGHVRLGEIPGRRIAQQVHEGLGALDDGGADRDAGAEPDLGAIPQPERERTRQIAEHVAPGAPPAGRRRPPDATLEH